MTCWRRGDDWTDEKIRVRAARLAEMVTKIWSVPDGHKSLFGGEVKRARRRLDLSDLIGAGMLEPGMTLYSRRRRLAGRTATLLPDGRIDVDSKIYDTPSAAATAMAGRNANGWGFFLVDSETRRSLRDVYQSYMEQVSDDVEDDELADDEDEDT